MATAGVSPAALELLQGYNIELKDFARARARYSKVMEEELVSSSSCSAAAHGRHSSNSPASNADGGDAANEAVAEAEKQVIAKLKAAWEEYVFSAQEYVHKIVTAPISEILRDASFASEQPAQSNAFVLPPAAPAPPPPPPAPGSAAAAAATTNTTTASTANNFSSSITSTTGADGVVPPKRLTAKQRAEKLSEFCIVGDKWFWNNESYFQLPFAAEMGKIVAAATGSSSRLMRLLGLHAARVYSHNLSFMNAFFENGGRQTVGLSMDRENSAEVTSAITFVERFIDLLEVDQKAYPPLPFGWVYRIASFIDPSDILPSLPPKMKAQAIRVALRILHVCPSLAGAVDIHRLLLRCCVLKGVTTDEERTNIIREMLLMFDEPQRRQFMRPSDISVLYEPFIDSTAKKGSTEWIAIMNSAKDVMCVLMSTWVGILWVATETIGMRTLVDVLHLPGDLDRKMIILSMFNRVIQRLAPHRGIALFEQWDGAEEDRRRKQEIDRHIAEALDDASLQSPNGSLSGSTLHPSTWNEGNNSDGDGGESSMYADADIFSFEAGGGGANELVEDVQDNATPTTKAIGYHVLDPVLGRLLLMLQYHGLPQALIALLQSTSSRALSLAAASVLQDILVLMDTTLPADTGSELYQSLNAVMGRLAHEGEFFLGSLASRFLHDESGGVVVSEEGAMVSGQKTFHMGGRVAAPPSPKTATSMLLANANNNNNNNIGISNGSRVVGGVRSFFVNPSSPNTGNANRDFKMNDSQLSVPAQGGQRNTHTASSLYGLRGYQVDDISFMAMLRDSNVEVGSNHYFQWNLEMLLLLLQGPLRDVARMRYTRDRTRFFNILVSFYLPASNMYLRTLYTLSDEECTSQLCVVGLALIDLLLSSREGADVLDRFGFTQAVYTVLSEVCGGTPRILTVQRLASRSGKVLIRLIGRYTTTANGLLLMQRHNVLKQIMRLFETLKGERVTNRKPGDSLQDVCHQLLQHMFIGAMPNYGVCEEIRSAFRTALSNEANPIRLCAIMQLRKSLWRDLSTSMQWGIETLLQALHDDFYSVVECAFRQLTSICLCSTEALDYLISLSPSILMENELLIDNAEALHTNTLLYCIVRRSAGFRFLQCYGWVETELKRWETSESAKYVLEVEQLQSNGMLFTESNILSSAAAALKRRSHRRTYSDMHRGTGFNAGSPGLSGMSGGSFPKGITDATANTEYTSYFPTHFSLMLCSSNEGCTFFKHSDLWQRSIHRILEQPLPSEDILDCDNDDDNDPLALHSGDGNNNNNNNNSGMASASTSQTDKPQAMEGVMQTGILSDCSGSPVSNRDSSRSVRWNLQLDDDQDDDTATRGSLSTANNGAEIHTEKSRAKLRSQRWQLAANSKDRYRTTRNGAITWLMDEDASVDEQPAQSQTTASDNTISAARGYESRGSTYYMDCVGDVLSLKDAILCVSNAGCSETGYGLVQAIPGLLPRLFAISRFATSMSVRAMALMSSCLLSRSNRGMAAFKARQFSVLHDRNAYVSTEGVPYSVSFSHMRASKWMTVVRKHHPRCNPPSLAHAEYTIETTGVPRRIFELTYALSNPVSREDAKQKLYALLKASPLVFLKPLTRQFLVTVADTYRMQHPERKFLTDLLDSAHTLAVKASKAKASAPNGLAATVARAGMKEATQSQLRL